MDKAKKILLYGGSGLVGSRLNELLNNHFEIVSPSHLEADLLNPDQIVQHFEKTQPDYVVYAAGYTNVDKAEQESELAYKLNAETPAVIASKASENAIPFLYFSTDYVFSGDKKDAPYSEDDVSGPVDEIYAKSKFQGEQSVLEKNLLSLVVRIIMPFRSNFEKKSDIARTLMTKLQKGEQVFATNDQKVNPVFIDDVVTAVERLIDANAKGIYHIGSDDITTPYDFVNVIADQFNLSHDLISPIPFAEFAKTRPAKRPQNTWLSVNKFKQQFGTDILHNISQSIKIFKEQIDEA